MMPEHLTFKLVKNSKFPTKEWRKNGSDTRDFMYKPLRKGVNRGVPTGKVNNITIVDLDFYDKPKKNKIFIKEESKFLNEFKDEFKEFFDTYAVSTPRGGIHLYFKYDEDIRQTANDEHQIDIRNDGGYVVAPKSVVNGEYYKVINDDEIIEMPPVLKEWLLNNIYTAKQLKKKKGDKTSYLENGKGHYSYNLTDDEKRELVYSLSEKYWKGYDNWLIFTTACKILKADELWDEINKTKTGYNAEQNINIWNGTHLNYDHTIDNLLLDIKQFDRLPYVKYKPTIRNKMKSDTKINKEKLGYDFFTVDYNYIVKSDTGTGKTTSFKHYAKSNNKSLNFLSIVSRVSLGWEQSISFAKQEGLDDPWFYKNIGASEKFKEGTNIVIQVDSIMRLYNMDFSNYVLFLDEFNSLIEYVITSPTLNKTRSIIYTLLIKIINQSKQIICVDADISDTSMRFLEFTNKKCQYIKNGYKHNDGVKATEIFDSVKFISQLKKEPKFMCCCDSKKQVELLYKELGDDTVKMITSDTTGHIDLDAFDKVIFSPKVIYGIDSAMKRPVYVYYKEHTITPTAMVQQIARCRNISNLYFLFTQKRFKENINTMEDTRDYLIDCNKLGCAYFGIMVGEIVTGQYMELLTRFEYNYDCYNTNKFSHFIKLLKKRGFSLKQSFAKTNTKEMKALEKELKQDKLDNFDPRNEKVIAINEILQIPDENIEDYKEFFLDPNLLQKHWNISKMITHTAEEITDRLEDVGEFNAKKARSVNMKLIYLKELKEKLGIGEDSITVSRVIENDTDRNNMFLKYKTIFRTRDNKLTFDTVADQQKYIVKMYDNLFGSKMITKCQTTVNKKKIKTYSINSEYLSVHTELMEYRAEQKDDADVCLFD